MTAETTPTNATDAERDVLLDVRDLQVHFPIHTGAASRLFGRAAGFVKAVDGVSFQLRRGEVLGLVGESGSGKTTLGRALLGLVKPTGGSIMYGDRDFSTLSEKEFRPLRRYLQMVFQDPHASLNPSMPIERSVGHGLRIHKLAKRGQQTRWRVEQALERVGLTPVERFLSAYPADLSGGQKQRAAIARSIILNPDLLVADEPVSMLDMSVRAKILELMLDLKNQLGLTYVYITHDLATAKFFCDRVAIMYLGRIVEIGPAAEIYANPRHPYTRSLLAAVPEPDPDRSAPRNLPRGEIPDAALPPHGCSFHPRCPNAFAVCGWENRDLRVLLEQRWLTLDQEQYDAESALVGDLTQLDAEAEVARLTPGKGDAGELLALLERIRDDDPSEPFWTGVTSTTVDGGQVVVRFGEGVDPSLLPSGAVQVACHLHDPAYVNQQPAAAR
jgi:oligopeptide/dipeptide ABC transporter ATP-binding protein